jgi:hypothetical protein
MTGGILAQLPAFSLEMSVIDKGSLPCGLRVSQSGNNLWAYPSERVELTKQK